MSKKGQGLSMNVIIIAALALLILVILTVLVINSTREAGDASSCESGVPAGTCISDRGTCAPGYEVDPFKACGQNEKCCLPL